MTRMHRGARLGACLLLALVLSTSARTEDKVQKRIKDQVQTVEGLIRQDNLAGVVLRIGGAGETRIPRADVARVDYAVFPGFIAQAAQAVEDENWEGLQDLIARAGNALRRADEAPNLKLAGQYFRYYAALLREAQGNFQDAYKNFAAVSNLVENSAVYFQAQLGMARMLEKNDQNDKASDKFRLAVTDFAEKQRNFKLGDYADRYILLAKLGHLRMRVKAAGEDERKLGELDAELDKVLRGHTGDADTEHAARRVRALIWRGQKEWEKLVDFLDDEILDGELNDRRRTLAPQYLERADANYRLEAYRAAALDYLRLLLVYGVDGEAAARAHYRLGECMVRMEPKEKEWEKKAKKHWAMARRLDIQPWATEAKDALKKLRETLGEAGGGEDKTEENANDG